jgi:flagellar hook assembly protein FlgD
VPLSQIRNYPNPFSGKTKIEYELKESAAASLEIYNIRGQKVRSFNEAAHSPGIHNLTWDGRDDGGKACASGVYYLRLQAGKQLTQRKMLLVK